MTVHVTRDKNTNSTRHIKSAAAVFFNFRTEIVKKRHKKVFFNHSLFHKLSVSTIARPFNELLLENFR